MSYNTKKQKKSVIAFAVVFSLSMVVVSTMALAKDIRVQGYTRSDGTYVREHIRSSPDKYRWNNYGPSRNSSELLNPRTRDSDRDGIPNYLDYDDDNDGIWDDNE